MCKVEVQVLARTEVRKEAKENTAFYFHGVPSVSVSHECHPKPHAWCQTPWKGYRVMVVGFSNSSPFFIIFQLIFLLSLSTKLIFPWSPQHPCCKSKSQFSSFILLDLSVYDISKQSPGPLKRLSSRGFQDMILSWFFSYWSGFAGFSSSVLNAQTPQCSVLGFLIVFLYPLSLTWCPHLVSALYNASYKPMAPKCTPVACPAPALLTQISNCSLGISSGIS